MVTARPHLYQELCAVLITVKPRETRENNDSFCEFSYLLLSLFNGGNSDLCTSIALSGLPFKVVCSSNVSSRGHTQLLGKWGFSWATRWQTPFFKSETHQRSKPSVPYYRDTYADGILQQWCSRISCLCHVDYSAKSFTTSNMWSDIVNHIGVRMPTFPIIQKSTKKIQIRGSSFTWSNNSCINQILLILIKHRRTNFSLELKQIQNFKKKIFCTPLT